MKRWTNRIEKKGERERESGPYAYAHVRKYETGRVIGLSAALCDRAATLLFIELSLMIENHYTLIVRVIRFTFVSPRPLSPDRFNLPALILSSFCLIQHARLNNSLFFFMVPTKYSMKKSLDAICDDMIVIIFNY